MTAMIFLLFQVADSLDLYPIPSAYQIRFQGCKGMLTMDPSLPHGDVREILQYRRSMKKFDSSHTALEICEATKPSEYFIAVRTRALFFWGGGGGGEKQKLPSLIRLPKRQRRTLRSTTATSTKSLPQNITFDYRECFAIILSRSLRTMLAKYPKT